MRSLPMRVLVLGDFRPGHGQRALREQRLLQLGLDDFESFLREGSPSVQVDLGPLDLPASPSSIGVSFSTLDHLRCAALEAQFTKAGIDAAHHLAVYALLRQHPDVQRLCARWLGLHALLAAAESDQKVRVELCCCSADQLTADFARAATMRATSLYLHSGCVGQRYSVPTCNLLVTDFALGPDAEGVWLLDQIARLAMRSSTLVFAEATPALLDLSDRPSRTEGAARQRHDEGANQARWEAFRATPQAARVWLTHPPWEKAETPGERSVRGSAAFVLGAAVLRQYLRGAPEDATPPGYALPAVSQAAGDGPTAHAEVTAKLRAQLYVDHLLRTMQERLREDAREGYDLALLRREVAHWLQDMVADFPGAAEGVRKRRPFRRARFELEPCDATSGWHRIRLAVTLHGTTESALPVWESEGSIDLRTGDV